MTDEKIRESDLIPPTPRPGTKGYNPFPPRVPGAPPARGSRQWYETQLCNIVENDKVGPKDKMHALSLIAKSRNHYQKKKAIRPSKKKEVTETPEPISSGLAARISNYKANGKGVPDGHQEASGSTEQSG